VAPCHGYAAPMKLLALDTCLGACSAAVFDGSVRAARRDLMQRGHAEVIAPMVQAVLREAGITIADVERIAVTTGPGSFTGQRIGLSLAQGLGLGRGIPVVGLDTMLATAAPMLGIEPVTVCHLAGATGQVYVQHFGADSTAESPILLQLPSEVVTAPDRLVIGTGATLLATGRRREELELPNAAAFAALAATLPSSGMPRPLYIREADAKPQAKTGPDITKVRIEPAKASASPVLAALHAKSFYHAWSEADIAAMLQVPGTDAHLAHSDSEPLGFVVSRSIAGEAEILSLCTRPDARKLGVATQLMMAAITELRDAKIQVLHLEVAADNTPAISLYEHLGFVRTGLRKAYYQRRSGAVDALLYKLGLA
jgi:tRNA threonylcarbamoyladenosine biosynthesis protein TsaB